MTEALSRKGLLLKLDLEQALERFHQGLPAMPDPQYCTPACQGILEESLRLARHQQHNGYLVRLFALALAFETKDVQEDPFDNTHITARFLHDYFRDEPGALAYVCDISPRRILKISAHDRTHILAARPPIPLPSPIIKALNLDLVFDPTFRMDDSGRVSIGPGEMWHPLEEVPILPEYSPLPEPLDWSPPAGSPPASPPHALDVGPLTWHVEQLMPTKDEDQPPTK